MKSLHKNKLSLSIATSCGLFIILNFALAAPIVFNLAEYIQRITGYYFIVNITILDYFLISLIPIFGITLSSISKKDSLLEILKYDLIIFLSCILIFFVGLLLLLSKLGTLVANPLIPEYLRIEPFKYYSSLFISFGIALPFIFIRNKVEENRNDIDEIGQQGF